MSGCLREEDRLADGSTLSRAHLGNHLDMSRLLAGENNSRKWPGVLKVKLNRTFSCSRCASSQCSGPNRTGYLRCPKHISNVATSQIRVLGNPPPCFGSRKLSHGIEFENGLHFNRRRERHR
jgi:hypothetical protein